MISSYQTKVIFLIASSTFFSTTALAGPPFQTDDPEPVDVGEHELYIAMEQTRTSDDVSGSRPLAELNYGPLPDLQIGIGIPYEFNNSNHGPTELGIGDVEVSAKYRFLQEENGCPMVSFFPMVALPTGDSNKGLGNGKPQILFSAGRGLSNVQATNQFSSYFGYQLTW